MPKKGSRAGKPGDVFTVRLAPGVYGLAWLAESGSPRISSDLVLVAADWFGRERPHEPLPIPRALEHPLADWEGAPVERVVIFASGPPSGGWTRVGTRNDVGPAECASFSGDGWEWMRYTLRRRWRLIHEPEAVAAEEANQAKRRASAQRAAARREAQRLDTLTLDRLARARWLPNWTGYPTKGQTAACRDLLRAAVRALRSEPKAPMRRKVQVIRELVTALNDIDAEQGFIETVCREDLCAAISDIAVASGLRTLRDWRQIADRWRDW